MREIPPLAENPTNVWDFFDEKPQQSEATLHLEAVIEDINEELQRVIFRQEMVDLQDWQDLPSKTLEEYPSLRLKNCLTDILFLCNYHDDQVLRRELRTIAGSLLEQIGTTTVCGKIQRNLTLHTFQFTNCFYRKTS